MSARARGHRTECLPRWLEADDRAEHVRHVLAIEGRRPVSISYSTQPNAQMSLRLSASRPLACSGACARLFPDDARAGQHGRARYRRRQRLVRPLRALLGCQRLREPEVQDLHSPVKAQLDVRGLEIAMDDALLVRGFKPFRDLLRDRQRFVNRNRPRAMRCDRSSPSTSSITSARTPPDSSRP